METINTTFKRNLLKGYFAGIVTKEEFEKYSKGGHPGIPVEIDGKFLTPEDEEKFNLLEKISPGELTGIKLCRKQF